MTARELRARRATLLDQAAAMVDAAEAEDRDLDEDESQQYEDVVDQASNLETRINRLESMPTILPENRIGMPNVNKFGLGDPEDGALLEARNYAHFLRTGDDAPLKELRASNDTTMNITTDADGGYAVPTGHYQGIIARRDESALDQVLGVQMIPGQGTSVNVPVDNEDDGEFVSTAESGAYDRDAPALDQKTMTLVKYTKKVDLTVELLEDEDSRIMEFLVNFIGRGKAKTDNGLLLTEVAANGTALKTFASATVIAVDEPEALPYNDAIEPYLDDVGSVAWCMRRSVHGEIILLDDANVRRYANNQMGNEGGPSLLGFPIEYSYKSGATAASAKSAYFGNWFYVGKREAPGMSIIRDPYSRAAYGEIILTYMYRLVYTTLIAEAIGYGVHPSA